MVFDLTTSTVEISPVENLVNNGNPYGGAWFDAYGSFYILENTGFIYRVDSVASESRIGENLRASNWRATLVGNTSSTSQNDATNGLTPIVTNQVSPLITCGVSTVTKTYTVFNPFESTITFDFNEDMRTVIDYEDDTTDQSASPLDGTFLPASLSSTHGGVASYSGSDQNLMITGMTVPASSTITFSIQVNTPDLSDGVYFSQARMFNLTSPTYSIASRANINSDDLFDDFRGHPTSLGVNCALLPVEMIDFNVEEKSGDAILDWSTASEVNNDYFVIERSVNASRWVEMARVEGHGTTNQVHDYTHTDNFIEKGKTYYYRLKQYDYDGTFDFSVIRHVTIKDEEASSDWEVYPNPVSRNAQMYLESSGCEECRIRIYSSTGNFILDQILSDGINSINMGQYNLKPGIYIIEYGNNETFERRKIIVQ